MATPGSKDFLGTGWAFPIELSAGKIGMAAGEGDVKQAIAIILGTAVGERVMEPTFGSRLQELVFTDLDPGQFQVAAHYAETALSQWEPRIRVTQVTVAPSPDREGLLLITINYTLRSRNQPQNLVYPFYLSPS